MNYNFDDIVPRRGTNSLKWDSRPDPDILPMWVADMDFATAEPVAKAVRNKAAGGVFGYTIVPGSYYNSVINWWKTRHCFDIKKEWILFCTGVIPAISCVVRTLGGPKGKVLVQTPVYNCFFSSIINNGLSMVENPLIFNGGRYEMDLTGLEEKLSDPAVRLMLLCNPHNPGGSVWSRSELENVELLCRKHNVVVVSDEIHCDLVYPGHRYTPFASINENALMNSITCTSPSKTFNIAGLQSSNIFIPNPELREKVSRAFNAFEIAEPNVFCIEATEAAYSESGEWLDELIKYLSGNIEFLYGFIKEKLPLLNVIRPEATYLVFIDCRKAGIPSPELGKRLLKGGLWVNDGSIYGKGGEGFIRINVACPRKLLAEGLARLERALA